MEKNFSAIIFDLGGVLYDIDVQESVKAFSQLGLQGFDKYYSLQDQNRLFDALETGKIGRQEFIQEINKIAGKPLSEEEIVDAWNALLLGISAENIDILRNLSKDYRLFLLSNTNEIHLDKINMEMLEQHGLNELKEMFEQAFFSFEMGLRKPGIEIFRRVLKETRLEAGDTLFIDDNADNVSAAQTAGLQALLKPRLQKLQSFLSEKRIL